MKIDSKVGPDLLERTSVKNIYKTKQAPELLIHAAATLVMAGDPFALNPEQRRDKAGEIGQFLVQVDPRFVGKMKRHHVDMAFQSLKEKILEVLRKHGVMAGGE